jgi:hypothetical protein
MALQRMWVTIAYSDGHVSRAAISAKVQVAFERQYKTSLAKLSEDSSATRLYQLAWEAERAGGAIIKDFESWLDEISAVDIENEEIRPFDAARPVIASPSSRSQPA